MKLKYLTITIGFTKYGEGMPTPINVHFSSGRWGDWGNMGQITEILLTKDNVVTLKDDYGKTRGINLYSKDIVTYEYEELEDDEI